MMVTFLKFLNENSPPPSISHPRLRIVRLWPGCGASKKNKVRYLALADESVVVTDEQRNASTVSSYAHQYASVGGRYCQQHPSTVALHSTEALMAGFLKSSDLGPHPHGYGTAHHPHHAHPHGPLPPGMPMTSLAPFGLPHGLDAVGFPQASV
uniref:Uncharacterized protein n=1 Tax=Anopheles maculatus TaxID=74869 RepID=A0A182T4J5_9DIPT